MEIVSAPLPATAATAKQAAKPSASVSSSATHATQSTNAAAVARAARYFTVFWCAASTKKHKATDTGFLVISPDGSCVLKDSYGKDVSKTKSSKALDEPSSLTRMGGYEIQVTRSLVRCFCPLL
jgi:hypothetical protein